MDPRKPIIKTKIKIIITPNTRLSHSSWTLIIVLMLSKIGLIRFSINSIEIYKIYIVTLNGTIYRIPLKKYFIILFIIEFFWSSKNNNLKLISMKKLIISIDSY